MPEPTDVRGPAVSPENNLPDVADAQAIVVGIDGSDASLNALDFAVSEAKATGRSIRLVGAYTIPSVAAATIDVSYVPIDDSAVRAAVTESLKSAAEKVKSAGVSVEAVIEIGDAAGVLVDESAQASLAVVGSRGRGGFAGRLLGTVSSALPAHSHCPTIVVPVGWSKDQERAPKQTSSFPLADSAGTHFQFDEESETVEGPNFEGRVVVGVDAMGKESPALWKAAELAEERGTPLTVMGVITTSIVGPEWLPSTEELKKFVERGTDKLEAACKSVREKHPNLEVGWMLLDGQPSEALVRASDTADILVVGTRGRGGFAGLLLGSTSQSVLPYSHCPTMVVSVKRD